MIYFRKFNFEVGSNFFNLFSDTYHLSMLLYLIINQKKSLTVMISLYICLGVLQNSKISQFLCEDGINQIFLRDDPSPCYYEIQRALKAYCFNCLELKFHVLIIVFFSIGLISASRKGKYQCCLLLTHMQNYVLN